MRNSYCRADRKHGLRCALNVALDVCPQRSRGGSCQAALHGGHGGLVGIDEAVFPFSACQPRSAMSASATLTPAWILPAFMPCGRAGSEKSTVAGSKPTNRT